MRDSSRPAASTLASTSGARSLERSREVWCERFCCERVLRCDHTCLRGTA
jgi:hypothetical protein